MVSMQHLDQKFVNWLRRSTKNSDNFGIVPHLQNEKAETNMVALIYTSVFTN